MNTSEVISFIVIFIVNFYLATSGGLHFQIAAVLSAMTSILAMTADAVFKIKKKLESNE